MNVNFINDLSRRLVLWPLYLITINVRIYEICKSHIMIIDWSRQIKKRSIGPNSKLLNSIKMLDSVELLTQLRMIL